MRSRTAVAIATTTIALSLALPGRAADRYYVGPHNGSWSDPANWSATPGGPGGAGVPAPGDLAFVSGVSPRLVELNASYASQLERVTVEGTGGTMTLRQNSSSSALFSGDQIIGSSGTGRYEQSAGSNTISHYQGFTDQRLELGQFAGSSGTYVMSGVTLSITSNRFNGGLLVGQAGQGTFDLSGGSVFVDANVGIGV